MPLKALFLVVKVRYVNNIIKIYLFILEIIYFRDAKNVFFSA